VPTDKHWVGLPVCVDIAPTKTLAKLVNHVAKKRPQFMLTEIIAATHRMPTLFDDTVGMARSKNLMHAVDSINQAYGRGTIRLAAEGLDQRWKMRAGRRSPAFTTCLSDVVVAHAT
jgi:DNA polymerase V